MQFSLQVIFPPKPSGFIYSEDEEKWFWLVFLLWLYATTFCYLKEIFEKNELDVKRLLKRWMEATSFRTYQVLWFLYLFSNFIVHNFHQIDLFPILEFAAIALFLKKHRSIQLSFSVLLFCPNGSVYVSLLKFRLYMIEIEAQDNFFDMCILLITCHLSLSINCKLALCHWEFVWTLCNHRQGGAGFARRICLQWRE